MNQEHIDYLNERKPVGISIEMIYKEVLKHIYFNILVLGNDVTAIIETNNKSLLLGPYEFRPPLTLAEATNYFIQNIMQVTHEDINSYSGI